MVARTRLHDEQDEPPPTKPQRPLRAASLLVLSMIIVPHMDAIAKYLGMHGHHVLQVSWMRMTSQFIFVAPLAA